jgi:peroxiredoxin
MNVEPVSLPAARRTAVTLLLLLPGIAAAADLLPRTLLAPKTAKTEMFWHNGQSLEGDFTGATGTELEWKSALFASPVKVSREFIRQVDFKAAAELPKGDFRVALADGSHFTGQLLRVEEQALVFQSERLGEVAVKREAAVLLERLNGGGLLSAGPQALLAGSEEMARGSANGAGPLRMAAAGQAGSLAFNQLSGVKLDLPEQCITDVRFRTDSIPEFKLEAGAGKEWVAVDTWGDELVLVMGDRFASAGAKFTRDTPIAHVRLAWDRKAKRCALYGSDGTLWAEIAPETAAAETEKKPDPAKKSGTWLNRLFGAPGQAVQVEGISSSIPQSRPQDGISLTSKGRGILIDRFSVSSWDGQPPPPVKAEVAGVETVREFHEGEPFALTGDKLQVKLKDGSIRDIPLAEVRAVQWARTAKLERDPAQTELWFQDGSLLRGKLSHFTEGKAHVESAFAAAPLQTPMTLARALFLPAPPKPVEEKEKALLPPPALAAGEVKPETKLDTLDTLTLGKSTLYGRIVAGGGPLPQFQLFGSSAPSIPSDSSGVTLAKALPPDAKYERAPALLHVAGQQSLPVTFTDMDRKRVLFAWEAAEKQEIPASAVHAVQFMSAPSGDDSFSSSVWQVVGSKDGSKKPARRPNGDIILSPGSGIGHPWVLQGNEITFKMAQDRGGLATLRIRLFCNGTQRDTGGISFIVADWGSELYCGVEREEGQLNSNQEVPSRKDGNEVRLVFDGNYAECHVNGVRTGRISISSSKKKRGGSGLILETASLWGNTEGSVKVFGFSTKTSSLMASPPAFSDSAKKEALLLPRQRRDDPPRHLLIGINGDLLRGEVEAATATHYAFRAGLENFKVPRDRVKAVVSLQKPDKPDPNAKPAEPRKEEKATTDQAAGGFWGNLFPARGAIRVQRRVIVNGVVVEDTDGEEKPEPPPPPDKDVPNNGEQWLDLTNGGRIALKVDLWEPGVVSGTHPLLGKLRLPESLIYRITMKPPPPAGAWAALSRWKLENTPDPVIPEGDGGSGGQQGSGQPAADFKIPTLTGSDFSLKDAKGKVIVLDFWATWCGPCVKSLPGLIDAMSGFPEDKVVFLTVNQGESKEQVQKFLEARGFKMAVGFDTDQSVGKKFGVEGIPHTVVVDPEGKIAFTKTGYSASAAQEITEAVQKALGGNGPAPSSAPAVEEKDGERLLPPPVLQ